MNKPEFQECLGVTVDGIVGDKTVAEFEKQVSNKAAAALTTAGYAAAATKLSTDVPRVVMIRKCEAGYHGSFDDNGRPTILFERHKFRHYSGGIWDTRFPEISAAKAGGYSKKGMNHADWQWTKLRQAIKLDPDAAIMSCSWGLFQVMGFHWKALGYRSALDFAKSMAESEAAQLDACVRYLLVNRLDDELRACQPGKPETCRALARGYNGTDYERNNYHVNMAKELAAAYREHGAR